MTILIILVAPVAGKTSDRIGSRGLMTAGMVLVAAQLAMFSQLSADASYLGPLPGAHHRRLRHGDDDDSERCRSDAERPGRQGGRRLGRPEQRSPGRRDDGDRAHGSDHGRTRPAASGLPEAFMEGFESALLVAAGIAVVGAIVAFTLVRPARRRRRAQHARPEPAA